MLLPLQFNDGGDVPAEWLADAVFEIVDRFGAACYETQRIEGHWRGAGVMYRDSLVRLIVDLPETKANRRFMKDFKARWKSKLQQLELWMVSYVIRHRMNPSACTEFPQHRAQSDPRASEDRSKLPSICVVRSRSLAREHFRRQLKARRIESIQWTPLIAQRRDKLRLRFDDLFAR